jgi:hypothetical protein
VRDKGGRAREKEIGRPRKRRLRIQGEGKRDGENEGREGRRKPGHSERKKTEVPEHLSHK